MEVEVEDVREVISADVARGVEGLWEGIIDGRGVLCTSICKNKFVLGPQRTWERGIYGKYQGDTAWQFCF